MPEYLAPGVYIEEFEIGAKPIEGVSTSTAGFVGVAEKGPLNTPTLVTSFAEYQSIFGNYLPEESKNARWLPYAIEGFFSNGGKRAYIVRVAKDAIKASGFIPDISGITTTLSKETASGSIIMQVANVEELQADDTLYLSDGAFSEYMQPKFVGDAKALSLDSGLAEDYTNASITRLSTGDTTYTVKKAVNAKDTSIELENMQPSLSISDVILIDKDEKVEIGIIDSISSTTITLESPLKYSHAAGSIITKLTFDANSPKAPVLKDSQINESILLIQKGDTEFEKGAAIKIEGEYFIIKGVETGNLLVKEKLRYKHDPGLFIKKLTAAINIEAANEGEWGNDIKLIIKENSLCITSLADDSEANISTFKLRTVNGMEKGTKLKIKNADKVIDATVKEVFKGERKVVLESAIPDALSADTPVSTVEFDLIVRSGDFEEAFKSLSMNKDHSRYIEKIITDKKSRLIRIKAVNNEGASLQPMPTTAGEPGWLLGTSGKGSNGIPGNGEFINVYVGKDDDKNPKNRTGLYALKNKEDISIVAIPGISIQEVQDKIIEHCESLNRFAVLDCAEGAELDGVEEQRNFFDSKYAALYYPWIRAFDPMSKTRVNVPSSGHICGIYARSDTERGVHKAPANEKINGALGLEEINGNPRVLTKGMQEILNPKGINCIRIFPGRGIRV